MGTITAQYRLCVASRGLDQLLETQRSELGSFEAELGRLKFALAEALQEEQELRALREAEPPAGSLRVSPPFVVSATQTTHLVSTRLLDATPIFQWRAACGWQFGLATHTFLQYAAPAAIRCSRCWRLAASEEMSDAP